MAATVSAFFMRRCGYAPKSIINVGVGSCPELEIWNWLFPGISILGIDPRRRQRQWTHPYIQAAASESSGLINFCWTCRSTNCTKHKLEELKSVAIDDVAKNLPKPYFIWMDIEGGEMLALKGARNTLRMTEFINIEVQDAIPGYGQLLHDYLLSIKYRLHWEHINSPDRLYRKPLAINVMVARLRLAQRIIVTPQMIAECQSCKKTVVAKRNGLVIEGAEQVAVAKHLGRDRIPVIIWHR